MGNFEIEHQVSGTWVLNFSRSEKRAQAWLSMCSALSPRSPPRFHTRSRRPSISMRPAPTVGPSACPSAPPASRRCRTPPPGRRGTVATSEGHQTPPSSNSENQHNVQKTCPPNKKSFQMCISSLYQIVGISMRLGETQCLKS